MSTTTVQQFERTTAEDVQVGDEIARSRTARFERVAEIHEGAASRRFLNDHAQTIMRPGRSAKLWKVATDAPAPTTDQTETCRSCGEQYVLPLDGDATRTCPHCGALVRAVETCEARELRTGDLIRSGPNRFREVLSAESRHYAQRGHLIELRLSGADEIQVIDVLPDLILTRRAVSA